MSGPGAGHTVGGQGGVANVRRDSTEDAAVEFGIDEVIGGERALTEGRVTRGREDGGRGVEGEGERGGEEEEEEEEEAMIAWMVFSRSRKDELPIS